ncbi:MAG: glycosyl hydrolase [Burkholderiaceae bacterium]|nr:glycosyl hydrolase [Burkholderiaceae bacterium]
MFKRTATIALALAAIVGVTLAARPAGPWQDVLDQPASKSAFAERALINGLAHAGERIVAVGQRGHVLLSDDEGKTWRQAVVPASSDLVAVTFATPSEGWAVGHDGIVLHSKDGGTSWTRALDGRQIGALMVEHYKREAATFGDDKRAAALLQEAERFGAQGPENPFLDIAFENATTGYLVGAFGLILRTTDGGATWQPMLHAIDNPKALHLYAVRAIGGEVYIAGEQGLFLKLDRSGPGGGLFKAIELPYKGTLFGIVGTDRVLLAYGLRGTVLRSTDAGRSWETVPTGVPVGLTAASIDAKGRIVIASQAGHVLVSTDNGQSFALAKLDKPLPAAAVALAGPSTVVVGGPRGLAARALP